MSAESMAEWKRLLESVSTPDGAVCGFELSDNDIAETRTLVREFAREVAKLRKADEKRERRERTYRRIGTLSR